ncbi:hypothetical protein GCM10017779_45070 [Streptomyces capillispiralis]|nr:hypothetical protein GCM10017779_45070 [Streptomyces capillispiralis]
MLCPPDDADTSRSRASALAAHAPLKLSAIPKVGASAGSFSRTNADPFLTYLMVSQEGMTWSPLRFNPAWRFLRAATLR